MLSLLPRVWAVSPSSRGSPGVPQGPRQGLLRPSLHPYEDTAGEPSGGVKQPSYFRMRSCPQLLRYLFKFNTTTRRPCNIKDDKRQSWRAPASGRHVGRAPRPAWAPPAGTAESGGTSPLVTQSPTPRPVVPPTRGGQDPLAFLDSGNNAKPLEPHFAFG